MRKSSVLILIYSIVLSVFSCDVYGFKAKSLLSEGKWVKITVKENGIYELSYDELRKFGFLNPEKVKVFGNGGNAASENTVTRFMDDLEQVPVAHYNEKLYFYGKGVVKDSITITNGAFYHMPVPNPYSRSGAYFLSDIESVSNLTVQDYDNTDDLNSKKEFVDTGTAVWYKNEELYNPGMTGKAFLGKDISRSRKAEFAIPASAFAEDGKLCVTAACALYGDAAMSVDVSVNGRNLQYESANNKLAANSSTDYLEYGLLTVKGNYGIPADNNTDNKFNLSVEINTEGAVFKGWIDYVSATYTAKNLLDESVSQTARFMRTSNDVGIRIYSDTESVRVWKVRDSRVMSDFPYNVKNCILRNNADGSFDFSDFGTSTWSEFIIFDVQKEQMHPEYAGTVENQNLHSIPVPDMLIITNRVLKSQAERLAEYHREYDGMDVLVVDQNATFNEFSSGVRDAMGYRRFCKMLYDRNKDKFKYLLLFGNGTYDNRMLYTGEDMDLLLTYQSDVSNSQVRSYSSDDFFAIFDEKSTFYTKNMDLAVGRLPFVSEALAKQYIDKLISYMKSTGNSGAASDNNIILVAEKGDEDIHTEQCETFISNFNAIGNYDMNFTKIYMKAYSDDKVARTVFENNLKAGANLFMFVGHGNPYSMTKSQELMTLATADDTHYPDLPIGYFSTCDVARFDNGCSNIVESLLLNREGGIIAAVASTRVVYTNLNGRLSDSFARSIAKNESYYGGDVTLGKVLLDAKNNSNETSINRRKYHLLGDPAMKIRFPQNDVVIKSVNGISLDGTNQIKVPVGSQIKISGFVKNEEGQVNADFNGFAIVKIYDSEKDYIYSKLTSAGANRPSVLLKHRGEELNSAKFEVKAGEFTGQMVLPEFTNSDNGVLPIRVFVSDDNGTVYSGCCNDVVADRSLSGNQPTDTTAPVIQSFYINSSDFKSGAEVSSDITVYAELSDNMGINASSETITSAVTLSLDRGKDSFIVNGVSPDYNGHLDVRVPIYGLEYGLHTAELTVADFAGNVARKTISFIVSDKGDIELQLDKKASVDIITVSVIGLPENKESETELFVVNDDNSIVYRRYINTFPFDWNLIDNDGNKLPPGDYGIYAIRGSLSTQMEKIVILK